MTTPGRGQVWTGEQLAARLVALGGAVPDVAQHVVYRATDIADPLGGHQDFYLVPGDAIGEAPGEATRLAPAAFDFWLAKRGLAGRERLSVALLVVRDRVSGVGDIQTCTLEYRRGAPDGPYYGSPARITFTGPAQVVRFFHATPEGHITEIAPTPGAPDAARSGADGDAEQAALLLALEAGFGAPVRVVGMRAPTVIEAMVGIASVLHVALPDRREAGCGILWHGPIAVALPAAFPRFDVAPRLSPTQQAALTALLSVEALVACETRQDEHGLAVLVRRPRTPDLFLVRFVGDTPQVRPYTPGPPAGLAAAQAQWLHYIETYEQLCLLDAYRDGTSNTLIVITEGGGEKVWRHAVDDDGVETWRTEDPGSAAATLHRERGGAVVAPAPDPPPTAAASPLPDSALFGADVDHRFPASAYDIDEAVRCLSAGRSTAAVFHLSRVVEQGLRAHATWRGEADQPSERRWRVLLRQMRHTPERAELHGALDAVRRVWRGAALLVGPKYTEAEAADILARVEHFMRCLARVCDEAGLPAGHLDNDGV